MATDFLANAKPVSDGKDFLANAKPVQQGAPEQPAEQPGMLERAWNWLNTPPAVGQGYQTIPDEVRSQISAWAGTHLPPKYAPAVAQGLDILSTPISAVEEAGRRMASPLGLATLGAGGVLPKVMPAIAEASPLAAKAITGGSALASGLFGAQGVRQAASALSPGLTTPERIERAGTGLGQAVLGTAGAVGPAAELVEANRVPKGTEEIFKAARPSPTNVQFRENLHRALPDVAETFRESPIESTHGRQVREVVDKLRSHANDVWKNEHEPMINEFRDHPIDSSAVAGAAARALGDTTGPQADPANVSKAQKWIEEELGKPMNLRQADQLRRDLNRTTEGKFGELSAPEYQAKKAALGAVRQQIYGTLESAAPGSNIRESNMRFGALNNLADTLERRINVAESQPGKLGQFGKTLRGYAFDTLTGGGVPSFGGGIRIGQAISALRGEGIGDVLERGVGRITKSGLAGPEPFRMPVNWDRRLGYVSAPTRGEVLEQSGIPGTAATIGARKALPEGHPPIEVERSPFGPTVRGMPTEPELYQSTRAMRTGKLLPERAGSPFEMPASSTVEILPPAERVPGKYAGMLDQSVSRLSPRSGEVEVTPLKPVKIKGQRIYLPMVREEFGKK